MSIKIDQVVLFDLLQRAFPLVPLKSSLQILSNFRIFFENGELNVFATDLDHSIAVSAKVNGRDTFDFTVNAKKIFEIVRELPQDTITIDVDENVLLLENESGFSCKIAGTAAGDFPGFPVLDNTTDFEINATILKNLIKKSEFAVAKDETRPCLTGILWEISNNRTGMVATDGHRLGSSFINGNFKVTDKISLIVSPKSLNQVIKNIDFSGEEKNINISVNEKYILFYNDKMKICTKQIEGPYPDYEKVIPLNNPKTAIVDKQALYNAVKRVSILSNNKTHLIKCTFSKDNLEIIVHNREIGGEAHEKTPIIYGGEKHTVGFNGQYFNEIINIIETPKIRIDMNTQISACLLIPNHEESVSTEDLFLIMPLRIIDEN